MDLNILGLTAYEEKAYRSLITLGKSTASQISRESGVSYGKIYEVLASLEKKGLVQVIPEATKLFSPTNPKHLIELVEKKKRQLDEIKEDLGKLKRSYDIKDKNVVGIVKGKNNFYKILRQLKEPKEFYYTIKYTGEYNPEWSRRYTSYKRKGIKQKSLVRLDDETKENVEQWLKKDHDLRSFPNKGIAMTITNEQVNIILIKNNILVAIKDVAFVDIMKTMFENSYHNSNKILGGRPNK